ncbi:MAG: prepilin peptidase [Eubacterium sp.]
MDCFIGGLIGLISGLWFYFFAVYQVKVRCDYSNQDKLAKIKEKKMPVVWMILTAVMFALIFMFKTDVWERTQMMLFFLLALNISAVDLLIRRIPNPMLLCMIVLKIADIVVRIISGESAKEVLIPSLIGIIVGYIMFMLPTLLKVSIGAGDVKYSIVLGFYLGIYKYVQAMVIMAILLSVYLIYLKLTKKGGMKTSAPMGPYISIGAIFVMFVCLNLS